MNRPRLKNYRPEYQKRIDDLIVSLIDNASLEKRLRTKSLKVKGYVCDVVRGRAKYHNGVEYFIVPEWALDEGQGQGYFEYYVAHELSHSINSLRNGERMHSDDFYEVFINVSGES